MYLDSNHAIQPDEGGCANVNGCELYFELHGDGEPLVLLHGFMQSGQAWAPYLPTLSKHYRLIVPDLRGHGRSTNPTEVFSHRQAAEDIAALLDQLEMACFKAIGFSSGGMILVHLATRYAERLKALTLLASTNYFPEPARKVQRDIVAGQLSDNARHELRKIHVRGDAQIHELQQQFHDFSADYQDMNFTGPLLSTISAPTLIVHGDRDPFFEVGIAVELYRSIPNSYLWILPNTGHGLVHSLIANDSDVFFRNVLDFLAGEWDEAGE